MIDLGKTLPFALIAFSATAQFRHFAVHKNRKAQTVDEAIVERSIIAIVCLMVVMFVSVSNVFSQQTFPCTTATTANWQTLGPTTVPTNAEGLGWVSSVAFHPTNANILYAAGFAGGMWKSTDKGANWSKLENNQSYFDRSHISVIATTSNANILYAATGKRSKEFGGDYPTTGVFKSTDGGATWSPTSLVGENATWNFGLNDRNVSEIRRIVVHPTNPDIVFVAVKTRKWWNDILDGTQGALYKTINGGTTWTQVIGNTNNPSAAISGLISTCLLDVEYHPTNPSILYASGHRLFKSTNGGDTWSDISNTLTNFQNPVGHSSSLEIAVSSSLPNKLWVAFNEHISPSRFILWSYDAVANTSLLVKDQSNFSIFDIVADKTNASRLYGGSTAYTYPVYRSDNGGVTWVLMNNNIHTDTRYLAINPVDNAIYACTDGGLYSSPNTELSGASTIWTFKSNGMGIAQAGGFDVAQTDGRLLLATDHNRLFIYEPSTNSWRYNASTGDGKCALIDPTNSNNMYALDLLVSNNAFVRSTNAFTSSSNITIPGSNGAPRFIEKHPTNPNVIYAGEKELYKSTDKGVSWTAITNRGSGLWPYPINNIAIAPSNDNVIYFAVDNGISRTDNGGATIVNVLSWNNAPCDWIQHQGYSNGRPGDPLLNESVTYCSLTSLTVHPTIPTTVWATWRAHAKNGISISLFKSTDGGATWVNDSQGLPYMPAYSMAIDKESPVGAMYVSTESGVYYKDNSLSQWQCFNDNLPYGPVNKLVIRYPTSEIYASIYGRGIWKSKMACPVISTDVYVSNSNTPNLNKTLAAHNLIKGAFSNATTSSPLQIPSGTTLNMVAGTSIHLGSGFSALAGSTFSARINNTIKCDHTNVNLRAEDAQASFEMPDPVLNENDAVPNESNEAVLVYPNPTPGAFQLKTNFQKDEEVVSITIKDASGKLLKTIEPTKGRNIQINETFGTNPLFVVIQTNKKRYTEKVLYSILGSEKKKE